MADESAPAPLLKSEIEPQAGTAAEYEPGNGVSKRAREEDQPAAPNGEKRMKAESDKCSGEEGEEILADGEEKKMEEQKKEEADGSILGMKTFEASVELFDYFYKLLHTWPANIDLNKMSPRRMFGRDDDSCNGGRDEADNHDTPPDAATHVLEGMAQLLVEHADNSNRVQPTAVHEQFRRMNPQDFSGSTDPFVAEDWIRSLEVIFRYMNMVDADRIWCAIFLLKDDALLWWEEAERGVDLDILSWEDFKQIFYEKYFTSDVRSRLKREFMSLRQGDMTVAEFVGEFDRGCHFVPLIANDAAEKLGHFLDGLKPTVRRDVLLSDPTSYGDAVTRAFRAEQTLKDIEWEMSRKRPHQQLGKKPFTGQQRAQRQQRVQGQPRFQGQQRQQPQNTIIPKINEKPLCNDCGRHHFGKCLFGTGKCYKCGAEHVVGDCPKLRQPVTGRAYVMHVEGRGGRT